MRRIVFFAGLLLLITLPAVAQDAPKVEVFGGYQYARINPGEGISGINLNGWNAAIQGNLNNWFSIVGDFSGVYGSPTITIPDEGTGTVDTSVHTFLFGPQFNYRRDRFNVFTRALLGSVRAKASVDGLGISDTTFGMALGGGVDLNVNDRVAVRLFQADYVLSRFEGFTGSADNQHNFRLSTGLVIKWGSR